jgi:hypothetical protein
VPWPVLIAVHPNVCPSSLSPWLTHWGQCIFVAMYTYQQLIKAVFCVEQRNLLYILTYHDDSDARTTSIILQLHGHHSALGAHQARHMKVVFPLAPMSPLMYGRVLCQALQLQRRSSRSSKCNLFFFSLTHRHLLTLPCHVMSLF